MQFFLRESFSAIKNKNFFCPICKSAIPVLYRISFSSTLNEKNTPTIQYQCSCSPEIKETPISTFLSTETSNDNNSQIYCPAHPGNELNNYCENCKIDLCNQCSRRFHRHHNIIPLEDYKMKIYEEMKFKSYEDIEKYYIEQFSYLDYIKNKQICFIKTLISRFEKLMEDIQEDFRLNINYNIQLACLNLLLHKRFYEENPPNSRNKNNVLNLFKNISCCYYDEVNQIEPSLKSVVKKINSIKSKILQLKKENHKVLFSHFKTQFAFKKIHKNFEPFFSEKDHTKICFSKKSFLSAETFFSCNAELFIEINSVIPINSNKVLFTTVNGVFIYDIEKKIIDKKENDIFNNLVFQKSTKLTDDLISICSNDFIIIYSFSTDSVILKFPNYKYLTKLLPLTLGNNLSLIGTINMSIFIFYNFLHENELYKFEVHEAEITGIIQLQNGKIVTGSYDNLVKIWEFDTKLKDLKLLSTIDEHCFQIEQIKEILPNVFATVSTDETIKIWNANDSTLKLLANYEKFVTTELCVLEKGSFCFGRGNTIVFANLSNTEHYQVLEGHTHKVNRICYIKNKNMLVSFGNDYNLCFWDIERYSKLLQICIGNNPINLSSCLQKQMFEDIIFVTEETLILHFKDKLILIYTNNP